MAIQKHPFRTHQIPQAIICSLISLYGFSATEPTLKVGEWVGNRTLILADLPLPPKPLQVWTCLKPDDTKKQPELLSPLKANGATLECAVGERTINGSSLTAPLTCTSLGKNGRLEMTIAPSEVQSKLVLYRGDTEQTGVWMTITDTHSWASEACTMSR